MATRSRIAQEQPDGTVKSIYCHWDGYPENNGNLLINHYSDPNKLKQLIELGDVSYIAEELCPPQGQDHSFDNPIEGVVVAYHRDRQDVYNPPRINKSIDDFFNSDIEEHGYLLTIDGEWLYKSGYPTRLSAIL